MLLSSREEILWSVEGTETLESDRFGFEFLLWHLRVMWPLAGWFPSLAFSFAICQIRVKILTYVLVHSTVIKIKWQHRIKMFSYCSLLFLPCHYHCTVGTLPTDILWGLPILE